ncbi:hypothetical protein [Spirosoma sp.]|uniref:hypothetical protein n=1 Tax=Spirosoma sp. TaxID=1899569 RepID=UPI002633BC62|nr:hypothetical protein [Spirosoma sp.]MCX6215775.1 hypothetical protein [Spirosoma sp.]
MKVPITILIRISFLCALYACKSDKEIRPEWFAQGWGEVSAIYNGGAWSNIGSAALSPNVLPGSSCQGSLTVQIFKFSRDGYAREILQFSGIPKKQNGNYTLTSNALLGCSSDSVSATFNTFQDDGDVGKSTYKLDISQPLKLQIISYSSNDQRIVGNFEATFIKGSQFKNDDPAVIKIEAGKFDSPISIKGRFE